MVAWASHLKKEPEDNDLASLNGRAQHRPRRQGLVTPREGEGEGQRPHHGTLQAAGNGSGPRPAQGKTWDRMSVGPE